MHVSNKTDKDAKAKVRSVREDREGDFDWNSNNVS